MCDSLGKKNFNKVGLAAIVIEKQLRLAGKEANSFEEAKRQAVSSTLLELKRTELEALAAEVKGPYQNWGTFAVFASSNLSKKSFKKA
jgi:hypothetical protein